ncbi:hypothetical protein [Caballeronia sp. LZ032]|uniref:hypothetical protein n=1 Tax=Caballeronia sp. LZ032 TaxID=3038565 RepID=UPI0028550726|nr:hypothetical protein [Caballeronia sp. LZ032]MDR5882896.1 hypothetical protein [Caballeronia sp. LZ032]
MSSTAQEWVECAAALMRHATTEPQYRTVCSRAYYGAFHAANEFHRRLPAPGTVGRASGRHDQLIQQLCNPMIRPNDAKHALSKAIGLDLITLRNARVRADYHPGENVNHDVAEQSTQLAAKVIRKTT